MAVPSFKKQALEKGWNNPIKFSLVGCCWNQGHLFKWSLTPSPLIQKELSSKPVTQPKSSAKSQMAWQIGTTLGVTHDISDSLLQLMAGRWDWVLMKATCCCQGLYMLYTSPTVTVKLCQAGKLSKSLKAQFALQTLAFLRVFLYALWCTLFRLWFQPSFNKVVQLDHLSQWQKKSSTCLTRTIYLLCPHLICDHVWSTLPSITPLSTLPSFSPSVRSPDTGEQSNGALVEKATHLKHMIFCLKEIFSSLPPETWLSGLPSSLRTRLDTGYLIIKLNHVRQSLLVLNPVALSAIWNLLLYILHPRNRANIYLHRYPDSIRLQATRSMCLLLKWY